MSHMKLLFFFSSLNKAIVYPEIMLIVSTLAPTQLSRSNCKWTNYVNNWDGQLTFVAPRTSVIVGTDSYHDNGKE